jgi:hypothetical protein
VLCCPHCSVTSFSTNRHNFEGLLKLLRIVDAEEMLPSHEFTTKFDDNEVLTLYGGHDASDLGR